MNISIFEVLGPVMVGPSSSHTAGAVRIGNAAALVSDRPVTKIDFGLFGSFAQTGAGHGTPCALLAGAMGMKPDDERIPDAFAIADEKGLQYSFYPVRLKSAHENSTLIKIYYADGSTKELQASSVGGGRIMLNSIDGFRVDAGIELPTLLIENPDIAGVISEITGLLARTGVNIANMRVTRSAKGERACCVIETDVPVAKDLFRGLMESGSILGVTVLPAIGGEC